MLRKTLPVSPKIQKYAQSRPKANVEFVAFFKKAAAFLKNIRARWKTHSYGDNDVIVIKQISASANTA